MIIRLKDRLLDRRIFERWHFRKRAFIIFVFSLPTRGHGMTSTVKEKTCGPHEKTVCIQRWESCSVVNPPTSCRKAESNWILVVIVASLAVAVIALLVHIRRLRRERVDEEEEVQCADLYNNSIEIVQCTDLYNRTMDIVQQTEEITMNRVERYHEDICTTVH